MRNTKANGNSVTRPVKATAPPLATTFETGDFIPGPQLRAKIGISAVTLWRWRNDERLKFPKAKRINARLYFPLSEVNAWLNKQPSDA